MSRTYRFRLEFARAGGSRLMEVALERADFSRAVESAFFDGLRQGRFDAYAPPAAGVRIEPRFRSPNQKSPKAGGFTVVVPAPGGEHRVDFSSTFFQPYAQRLLTERLIKGDLEEGTIVFHLAAYLDDRPRQPPGMLLEADEPAVPIRPVAQRSLGHTAAWDEQDGADVPVLIPRHVLEEAVDEAKRVPDREVGGFLLGHLCRDPEGGELFLHVTCHVPAEATEATQTSVTFTPESWQRAREVIAWRGEGEIFAGWVHSHPFRFCDECTVPAKPECVGKVLFFSPEDRFLMELTFPQPFMVGLQTAVEPKLEPTLGHLPVRLYGWRHGEIVPRGFEVIQE